MRDDFAPGLPRHQVNAHLDDDIEMRVGIPHSGGKLAINAFNSGYKALVSASAFWNSRQQRFVMPEYTPLMDLDWALDSAGFVACMQWKAKGAQRGMAGVFPWTYAEYLEFAALSGATWHSSPDLACEPQIASNDEEVDYRVRATATLLEGMLQILYEWQNALVREGASASTIANMLRPPVPILQGFEKGAYLKSLDLTMQVWERWQPWLAPPALMGLGSVCRRPLAHPDHGLFSVLSAVHGSLPEGVRLHCFGVKGAQSIGRLKEFQTNGVPLVASMDSMAYDLSARIKAHQQCISNTFMHRCDEMNTWMRRTLAHLQGKQSDRFRLVC